MSEATTELVLDLDISEAEGSLEAFEKAMENLQETMSGVGKTIQTSLGLLQASLHKTVIGVNALNKSVQSLMQQMSNEQRADQLAEGVSTTIEGISLFATVIKPAKKAIGSILNAIGEYADAVKFAAPESGLLAAVFPKLSSMLVNVGAVFEGSGERILGVLSKFGPKIAVIAAIATVAIGAITALVANWDKICSAVQIFVTETLPQAWNQLTQWFQDVGTAITGYFASCWDRMISLWCGLVAWIRSIPQMVSDIVHNLGVIIRDSWENIKAMWNSAVLWIQEKVIVPICNAWNTVCAAVENAFAIVRECLAQACAWIYTNVVVPLGELLCGMWDGFADGAKAAWDGIGQVCKNAVNGIIGVLNVLLAGLTGALNGVFKLLNKISVDVPDWVPGMGGQTFGFKLKELSAPKIPYLAKGAVLPANKPFLAMVGDQKHGTNVEAPLSTIQEAVAVVLDEQLSALMAGFNATVQEIRLLRETVGNIRVGDDVIYRAAERYREKRAVMHGTGW